MKKNKDTNRVNLGKQINALSETKNIDKELLFSKIKEALVLGYSKEINPDNELIIDIDERNDDLILNEELLVVSEIKNRYLEITLEEAKKIDATAKLDTKILKPVNFSSFSYFAILKVSQVIKHFLNISESEQIYEQFIDKKGSILRGTIENIDYRYYSVDIGNIFAFITKEQQIPNERVRHGQFLRFYVLDVFKNHQYGQVMGSRIVDEFLIELFELEVPEVKSGVIKIEKVCREPGIRAKVAVSCQDPTIDPIGSCIGRGGKRISAISSELNGEKIDIFLHDEKKEQFIINACSPSKVVNLTFFEENKARIIVLETQYPVAIGKNGSAIRLLKKITDLEIEIFTLEDIVSELEEIPLNGNLTYSDLKKLEIAPEILSKCFDIKKKEMDEV